MPERVQREKPVARRPGLGGWSLSEPEPCVEIPIRYHGFAVPNVFVVGYGSGSAFYSTNQNNPPVITVQPGVFVDGSSAVNAAG